MLIESVLRSAEPYLQGIKVRDAVVGISLIGVELDNGHVGISYVLREDLDCGCSVFPYGGSIIGQDATDIAQWAISGEESLQKGIGVAVLTAASQAQSLLDSETPDRPFGVEFRKTDTVGVIGFIPPVVKMLSSKVKDIYVFDKGISECGGEQEKVLAMEEQPHLLPTCDIVMITGTTMINGTIDELLRICNGAREIIMVGPSTPMFPLAFQGTRITVLAGSWWRNENKNDIFKSISLACGNSDLGSFCIKKTVRVPS